MHRALPITAIALSLLAPLTAWADEFDDFRIPAHSLLRWDVGLNAQGSRSSVGFSSTENEQRFTSALSSTDWFWSRDSEPFTTSFSVAGQVADTREWAHSSSLGFLGLYDQTSRRREIAREGWAVQIDHRHHPWTNAVGLRGRARVAGDYSQRWEKEHDESLADNAGNLVWTRSVTDLEVWGYRHSVSGDASVGIGRVRDATGVYTARVLEDRLLEAGTLTRPLSREARQRLIDLMTVRVLYSGLRERPGKDLWREIEKILEADGALAAQGLGPRSVLRAGEPHDRGAATVDVLPVSPVLRRRGAFGGLLFSASHTRTLSRMDVDQSTLSAVNGIPQAPATTSGHFRSDFPFDDYLAGAEGEYHRPIGLRWQADAGAQVGIPLRSEDDGYRVSSFGSLAWLVADRWLAQASVSQEREVRETNGLRRSDDWLLTYGAALTYFVEDRLAIQLSVFEQQLDLSAADYFTRQGLLSLGVTYRLMGGFRAPGIMDVGR